MTNVYNHPEAFGLETVGEYELREPDYSFDIYAVWRDPKTGKFYSTTDSGCSCPAPFEDVDSIEELTVFDNAHAIVADIRSHGDTYEKPDDLISRIMAYPAVKVA